MKSLVIYDTLYGNTEQVAKAIANGIGGEVHKINEIDPANLKGFDLLIIGAPTQGGRTTKAMLEFLDKIPDSSLKGANVAVFDTRLTNKLVGVFGYAAGRIEKTLKEKGANAVVPAEGFFVKGAKGPIKDGEIERATSWAKKIAGK
jgi:flavodoxin I